MEFIELREKYKEMIYHDFEFSKEEGYYLVKYHYEIIGLDKFETIWKFPYYGRNINEDILKRLFFELGIVESISYWKCTCPYILSIECGNLTEYQKNWWKKLFYNGLGEFMYKNNIIIDKNDFIEIKTKETKKQILVDERELEGCLVPIGGGKDSIVSLELLKDENITMYKINQDTTTSNLMNIFEKPKSRCVVERKLDKKIIEMNNIGFLNGHIPFSAVVAFSSMITAYLIGKKYIVLSNESSANESTVKDSFVNHQYSKSYEFEVDFMNYINSIVKVDILYFSLLRPLLEVQIAYLFSKYKKYHSIFRSCNVGSKLGIWCCDCSKCLFVFIILFPFLNEIEMIDIFGENLLNKESNEKFFRELIGIDENKPFECVGTRLEVKLALKKYISNGGLSFLTNKYREFIMNEEGDLDSLLYFWNNNNSIPKKYINILKENFL